MVSRKVTTDIFALLIVYVLTSGTHVIAQNISFRHIVIDREFPRYPHCKTVGDIDGDGLVDVLVASDFGQGLYWYAYPNWTKHRIDLGSFTTDMQVGDVDKDGDLDVIIPKEGTGLVWYENPQPNENPVSDKWKMHKIDSNGGHDVEVGNIDQDGRLDILVRTGQTRVFLQKYPDSWQRIVIPTGGRGGTALGDLDGDGDLDIAENGYWLETPKDKNGEWKRHDIASGWPDDCGVHIVDINGDGKPDVLLAPAETHGKLVWYETDDPVKGPWKEHVIDDRVSYIHTFKTADVDKDGNLDVVTSEMEQSPQRRISVYYNKGKALQWQHQVVGRSGSHNVRIADIGNDGDIDIIGANHGNYGGDTPVEIWENLMNQPAPKLPLNQWQRHVIDPQKPNPGTFIHAGDLDGDGLKEIVTGAWWYKKTDQSDNSYERKAIGDPLKDAVLVADFDRDGDLDILGTQGHPPGANSDFSWARNDGNGQFTILTNIESGKGDFLQGCELIFTAYRKMEVALSWHRGGQGVQMLTIPDDPSKQNWTWRKISNESQDEQVSEGHIDIDRDNRVDLLLGTKWLRNDGKSWSLFTLNPTTGDPDRNRLADINNDGRPDAVIGFEAINKPGKLAWYENPKSVQDNTWQEHVIEMVVGPMSLDVADMDRDGDMDVVVGEHNYAKPETAKLHLFENVDGDGKDWKDHLVFTGDEHHDGAIVTDIDNDGDLDIISIGWKNPRVLLYENKAIGERK